MSRYVVAASTETHSVVTLGPVVGVVWKGRVPHTDLLRMGEVMRSTRIREGKLAACVTIKEGSSDGAPDDAARIVLANIMRDNAEGHRGLAYFVPVAGFLGAIVRGSITSLNLLARQSFPTKVFSSLGETYSWIADRLEWSSQEIEQNRADFERAVLPTTLA